MRDVFGRIMVLAPKLAREQGAKDGFRLIVNTGRVGRQEVDHVHLHIIGGGEPLGCDAAATAEREAICRLRLD